jgi:hypothetical protein
VPLTAQHACTARPVKRTGKGSHRSVARSSLHTSLTLLPSEVNPPHTTNPGSLRSHSFAPTRAALHTRIIRHAATRPPCSATRGHTSGRAVARSTAQFGSSSSAVVGGAAMVSAFVCVGEA